MNCEADAEFPVRIFVTSIYGRNAHHRIEPSKYRCAELAADLADAFAPIQLEVAGSTSLVLGGMRSFNRLRPIALQISFTICSRVNSSGPHKS